MDDEKSFYWRENRSFLDTSYLLTVIPNHIIDELAKIQNSFICDDLSPKLKHGALRMDFKAGSLKMLIYVLSLSVFTVLRWRNYLMNVFINGR